MGVANDAPPPGSVDDKKDLSEPEDSLTKPIFIADTMGRDAVQKALPGDDDQSPQYSYEVRQQPELEITTGEAGGPGEAHCGEGDPAETPDMNRGPEDAAAALDMSASLQFSWVNVSEVAAPSIDKSVLRLDINHFLHPNERCLGDRFEAVALEIPCATSCAVDVERPYSGDYTAFRSQDVPVEGLGYITDYRLLFFPIRKQRDLHCDSESPCALPVSIPWRSRLPYGISNSRSLTNTFPMHPQTLSIFTSCGEALTLCISTMPEKSGYLEVLLRGGEPQELGTPADNAGVKTSDNDGVKTRLYYCYDPEEEFKRIGFGVESGWMVVENHGYKICPTYPRLLGVPRVDDDKGSRGWAEEAAACRKQNRLPVLAWRCKQRKVAICRSAQPKGAELGKDVALMRELAKAEGGTGKLFVVDCRSAVAAHGNRLRGGGTEAGGLLYGASEGVEGYFCSIGNIHDMREALLNTLRNTTLPNSSSEARLAWRGHIENILFHVRYLAGKLYKASNLVALIHCSDGWDRTSQFSSLLQLCLDPYYRTVEGFVVLVEKEWLSFGHMFGKRGNVVDIAEYSPIFLQFLECVAELVSQQRTMFEFDCDLLRALAYHTTSGRFPTFLYNCEREREEAANSHPLPPCAFWEHLLEDFSPRRNPNHIKTGILLPNISAARHIQAEASSHVEESFEIVPSCQEVQQPQQMYSCARCAHAAQHPRASVTSTPVMEPHGSVHQNPGYHHLDGLPQNSTAPCCPFFNICAIM